MEKKDQGTTSSAQEEKVQERHKQTVREKKRHSGMGIASFVTAIVYGLVLFCVVLSAGIIEASTQGGIEQDSSEALIIFITYICVNFIGIFGIALGVIGLFSQGRKKILAFIGLVLNLITVLAAVSVIVLSVV
ncbi:MAG: hypothetical protein ACOCXT_01945 [Candidatus Dojkabacteria bacterium]